MLHITILPNFHYRYDAFQQILNFPFTTWIKCIQFYLAFGVPSALGEVDFHKIK
jgi:hypothetical protein